jgi:DNA-binding response OmpR family regulator
MEVGMPDRILLVDDDPLLLDSVSFSLERAGYEVETALSGAAALEAARQHMPDLAILDVGLPDQDGLRLCQSLQLSRPMPIIFLTAHDREMDVILGFERGADDYVTKPFSMAELMVRVGAVLRRARAAGGRPASPPERYEAGDVSLDLTRHEVRVRGQPVELPPKEFDLLKTLISHPGEALSRQDIVDAVWGQEYFGDTRVLDVHIRWLRELIEADPANPAHIQTVRGVGYRFANN